MDPIDAYLNAEAQVLGLMPREPIRRLVAVVQAAREEGRRIFLFGNGGSAANASHLTVDLLKNSQTPGKKPLRAICLNENIPTLTAYANDVGYDAVFAGPLAALAEPGDVVIAISGSGNSPNVLRAVGLARERGLTTVGLTGMGGGKLKDLVDLAIVVPSSSMQLIEDTHLVILHAMYRVLCDTSWATDEA